MGYFLFIERTQSNSLLAYGKHGMAVDSLSSKCENSDNRGL